ncbi:hypothetical protein [Roseovarius phycicola]|uniref:hypothetical protein n=1 Tax=Roseovarius phycicola TaxID=3080976 RepID=UPI0030D6159A
MINEFRKYQSDGLDAEGAYLKSKQLGLDFGQRMRMLTQVYGLSLAEYKVLAVRLDTSLTINEYQEQLLPDLEEAMKQAHNDHETRRD